MGRVAIPTETRFWPRVQKDANESGCWLWTGGLGGAGQGVLGRSTVEGGGMVQVTRFSYELANGPIPEGMVVVPVCEVERCVRPDHLAVVTRQEVIAGTGSHIARQRAARTHCPKGHPYDATNTYVNGRGSRSCRACWGRRPASP